MLLLPSDIVSPFLFCFNFLRWTEGDKVRPLICMWWLQWEFLWLHALNLISPLMNHSLMLRYSWMTPLDSFSFTLLPQQNKGLQYFISCYCCLFLLHWAQKPWLHKGTCILLYDHMWKTISVSKNLCHKVRWKQQVKRKWHTQGQKYSCRPHCFSSWVLSKAIT